MRLHHLIWALSLIWQVLPGVAEAAPEWRHAADHERKLFADVLLGDERGTYWGDKLPEGWVWLTDHKPPADDYYRLDQVEPRAREGKVVFVISKWNFFGINRRQFSLEKLAAKSREIDASKDVEFRESDEGKALLKKFAETDEKQAAEALKGQAAAGKVTIKTAEMRMLVVKAESGRVGVVLFERFGGCALVRTSALPKPVKEATPSERPEAFDTDGKWSGDVDGDGAADLEWVPRSETEEGHVKAAGGASVSLAGSAK